MAGSHFNPHPSSTIRAHTNVSNRFRGVVLFAIVALLLSAVPGVLADEARHINADLVAVGNSGVSGHVKLVAMPSGGTLIQVVGFGLTPGVSYVSLYYDNHVCALEPYSEDDVI